MGGKVGHFSKVFELTKEVRTTFKELKVVFTTAPVLWHYNTNLPVRLETDASSFAILGILSQQNNKESLEKCHWHPMAFWSCQMLPAEWNYHAGQTELLAIVMVCKHWHHYLDGADVPVNILSDHGNLRNFMTMKELTGRMAQWWELLLGFRINIVWCSGKDNPVDSPSRRPDYENGTPGAPVGYTEPPQPAMPMSRVAKCQLRKTHPNGGDVESERRDSVGPTMLAALYVLDNTIFGQVRVVATWEGAYLDPTEDLHTVIAETQGNDPLGAQVRKQLKATTAGLPGGWTQKVWWVGCIAWCEHEGILHFDGKLYVPPEGGAHAEVLWSNHDSPLAGHFGYARTLELIQRKYYWPHMAKGIKVYMKSCMACQQAKPTRHKPYRELQSLQQPRGPYTNILMDFIVGLPPSKCWSKAYNSILVIMDWYTKMACYVVVRSDIDTPRLAAVFVQKFVLAGPGVPDSIVSDWGSVLTLTFWSTVCYHLKVCRRLLTAFHPQTNGQMERQNLTLEQYLRAYIAY